MTEANQRRDEINSSFAAHVRAFHESLPPREQQLLEMVFRLAEQSTVEEDTHGHTILPFGQVLAGTALFPGSGGQATAQFNPKELSVDKSVPWQRR